MKNPLHFKKQGYGASMHHNCFILLLMLMLSSATYAQEFTLFPWYLKDSFPIIREVEYDSLLLNTNYEVKNSFSLIDLSTSSFKEVYMGSSKVVLDFEIIDKEYVYFCGYNRKLVLNPSPHYAKNAVMGYFPISYMFGSSWTPMTTQPILDNFGTLPLESLNRLEFIFCEDGGIHIIMTGTTLQGESCIVDVAGDSFFPTSWDIHYDVSNQGDIFDDIAVTDNYYILSYRNDNRGFLRYYSKPTSWSNSTLPTPIADYEISYHVDAKILMESYEVRDSFATLTYSEEVNAIAVSRYSGIIPQNSVLIYNPTNLAPDEQLYDIKYDRNSYGLEVLQRIYENGDSGSVIWHVTPDCFMGNTIILGHKFIKDKLHSIAIRNYNMWHTVATGHTNGTYDYLNKIYQIVQNQSSAHCADNDYAEIVNLKHLLTLVQSPINYGYLQSAPSSLIWLDDYWPFDYPCHYSNK